MPTKKDSSSMAEATSRVDIVNLMSEQIRIINQDRITGFRIGGPTGIMHKTSTTMT